MKHIPSPYRWPVYCAVFFLSCAQKNDVAGVDSIALKFSDLECRAYALREERFLLADKMRFAQDSIDDKSTTTFARQKLQDSLKNWLAMKQDILAQSLRLADTIKFQLDSIIKIKLRTQENLKRFDEALTIELSRRNCK